MKANQHTRMDDSASYLPQTISGALQIGGSAKKYHGSRRNPLKILRKDHSWTTLLTISLVLVMLLGASSQTRTFAQNQQYQAAEMIASGKLSTKDPTKVFEVGVSIKDPETDSVTALREEKIRQIMRDSNQPNYILFNHKISDRKLDLVYRNSLRLDIWQRMIEIRRENRRLGIFKINKSLSFWEITLGILLVCGLIWILLILSGLVEKIREYVDQMIFNSIVEISTDFLVLGAIFTVFNIISLYNMAITFQLMVNLEQIAVGGYTFILIWVGSGIYKIYKSQLKINQWDEFESLVNEQSELFRKYSQLKSEEKNRKLNKEETAELNRLVEVILYMNLRDDFIDPSFLPAVRESVYRRDFPFSDYLTIVHAKILTNYTKFRAWCYIEAMLVFLGLIFLIQAHSDVILLLVPVCSFLAASLVILVAYIHLGYILTQCTGKIQHEELIEFTNLSGRNQGYKIASFPRFLSTKDSSTTTILGLQNAQECMFWMRSPDLMISMVKAAEILIYSMIVLGSPILFYFWDENLSYFFCLLVVQALALAVVAGYLPESVIRFSICTNIVMMRDMESAQEAVEEQKKVLYGSYQACYRYDDGLIPGL
jgi:hypothetical protein